MRHFALAAALVLAGAAHAATVPTAGTLTPASTAANPLRFTAGPFGSSSAPPALNTPECTAETACETFEITLALPADWHVTHPDDHLHVRLSWPNAASSFTSHLLSENGTWLVAAPGTQPQQEDLLLRARSGTRKIIVAMVPSSAEGETITGEAWLETIPETPRNPSLAWAATGTGPQFQNYRPDRQGLGLFGGEATIDVNWNTGSVFYIGFLETLRVKFNDALKPATAIWENKSGTLNSKFSSDPLILGDPQTGRIWAQQLIIGEGQSLSEYSDDDGETWLPGGGGAVLRSGADHQGIGVGPYPAGSPIPHPLYPNALYYCSQDVALAYCSRSDDGGVTFQPGVPLYTVDECVGLHGHPKVAPDGTVYVPNKSCGHEVPLLAAGLVSVVTSEDAGLTWEIRSIPDSSGALFSKDPSVAIGSDGTLYVAYSDQHTRHLKVAVSKDRGLTWFNHFDVGAIAGVRWAEFPAATAGDPDRAAVAFFGSPFAGNDPPAPTDLAGADGANVSYSNDMSFQGLWYLYVATTYDGGKTWHVDNVTPGDPIQGAAGIGSGGNRNLYDFFDAVTDPQGRILVSYEDGCAGNCVLGGHNTFQDFAVIARQVSGKRLFAAFDAAAAAESVNPVPGVIPANVPVNAADPAAACTLPGILIEDQVGEAEAQPPTRDLASMHIAEPSDMPGKIVFTLTAAQAAPEQAGAHFFLLFDMPVPEPRYRLRLGPNTSEVAYIEGWGESEQGAQTIAYNVDATRAMDEGSGVQGDGTVRFILDRAAWGLEAGDRLGAIMGWSFPGQVGVNILTEEVGYDVNYIVQGGACGSVTPPPADPGTADEGSGFLLGALPPPLLAALALLLALRRRPQG